MQQKIQELDHNNQQQIEHHANYDLLQDPNSNEESILLKQPHDHYQLLQFGIDINQYKYENDVQYQQINEQQQKQKYNDNQNQNQNDKVLSEEQKNNIQRYEQYLLNSNKNTQVRALCGTREHYYTNNKDTINQSNISNNELIQPHSSNYSSLKRKCICKKTQCLKMYCQCFASNAPCTVQCVCYDCKNTLQHQKQIYQAKVMIRQKGVVGLHSCSLSEKRCNCKKSNCLKKYCQCYNSGVKCTDGCKCQDCKNKYQIQEKNYEDGKIHKNGESKDSKIKVKQKKSKIAEVKAQKQSKSSRKQGKNKK